MCLCFTGFRSRTHFGTQKRGEEQSWRLVVVEKAVELLFLLLVYLHAIFVRPVHYSAEKGRRVVLINDTSKESLLTVRSLLQRIRGQGSAPSDIKILVLGGFLQEQQPGVTELLEQGFHVKEIKHCAKEQSTWSFWNGATVCLLTTEVASEIARTRAEIVFSMQTPYGFALASFHRLNNACDAPWRLINIVNSSHFADRSQNNIKIHDCLGSLLQLRACEQLPLRLESPEMGDDAVLDLFHTPFTALDHLLGQKPSMLGKNFPWMSNIPARSGAAHRTHNSLWKSMLRPKVWSNVVFFLPLCAASIPAWSACLLGAIGVGSTLYHLAQTTPWYCHAWMVLDHVGAALGVAAHAWSACWGQGKLSWTCVGLCVAAVGSFVLADRHHLAPSSRSVLINEVVHSVFHVLVCLAGCSLFHLQ